MNYEEAEEYLLNIPKFTSKNEPEKTRAFLEEIGDFSANIPTIHVAGTNGKGSVCAYLRAGLEANGLKVGMFTSPHLVNVTERFIIGNEEMTKREFTHTFEYVLSLVKEVSSEERFEKYHPTFFEFLFFMAAVWFREKKPDVIILETGLGGRLDATNSIKNPVASVITEIGLDHQEYLGNTKDEIAFEKAGIIKPGVPVLHVSRNESFDKVIFNVAKEKCAPFYEVTPECIKNLETKGSGIDFSIQSLYDKFIKISLNTKALFQIENSALAFKTCEVLKDAFSKPIDLEKVACGFADMIWPGRMERVSDKLVIDGAHNEDGIKAFLETVKNDGCEKRVLLYSAVSDKEIEKVASYIKESLLFDTIYVCRLSGYRAADLKRMELAFEGANVLLQESVLDGLRSLMCLGSQVQCYAAGSLYLVGEIKALINEGKL